MFFAHLRSRQTDLRKSRKMALSGRVSSPEAASNQVLLLPSPPWSGAAGGGFGDTGSGPRPELWLGSHCEPPFGSQKPEGRGGRLGFQGRLRELGAGTGQSRNCPLTEGLAAGSAGVLTCWTFCRGILRPGSVSAERYVHPKCWAPKCSWYLG